MFAELITSFAPVFVAAQVLIPTAVFLVAMLFEGKGKDRWGKIRPATRKPFVSQPLRRPVQRAPSIGAGGLGFRRVSAARQEHE
jgi:hypothetical protein